MTSDPTAILIFSTHRDRAFAEIERTVRGSATTWLTNFLHEDTMLIYCSRRVRGLKIPDNIEVKKIPRDLLAKCAFEEGK
jgi:hypothetical protein